MRLLFSAETALDKAALLISILLSPVIVLAAFISIAVYYNSPSPASFYFWAVMIVVLVDLLPSGYIYYKYKKGEITDLHVSRRDQRNGPFAFAVLGASTALFIGIINRAPLNIFLMLIAILANVASFAVITRYYKISVHASTYVSSVVITGLLVDTKFFWLLVLAIPLCWARYRRKRHTFWQLASGSLISGILTYCVIILGR